MEGDAVAQSLVSDWRAGVTARAPGDLLFATWSGKPIAPNNVLRAHVFQACAQLGLPRAGGSRSGEPTLRLIRLRGHVPKGGYGLTSERAAEQIVRGR